MTYHKNIIIGFGKAGKTLAKKLSSIGEHVLLIEESQQMYGGTCINVGCIPSKSLITNANKNIPFVNAVQVKSELVSKLRNKNYHMISDESNIQLMNGHAQFMSNKIIKVTMSDGTTNDVSGERIFINTGSIPIIPNIQGLNDNPYVITSTQAMSLNKLPINLVIIGTGYIGLEFAAMFNSFGSNVTMIGTSEDILRNDDKEVAQLVTNDLKEDGITFHLGASIEKVVSSEVNATIYFKKQGSLHTLEADYILIATGRKPNIQNLGLQNTNIKITYNGTIQVNEKLETTVQDIYAMGDVKGGLQFTYISLDDYKIIYNQLYGDKTKTTNDRLVVPYTMFLSTPFSHVGITEEGAKTKGINYKVFKTLCANIPRANVVNKTRGMIKIIINKDTKKIVGATIYSQESHEIINLICLAIKTDTPYTTLRDMIYTHPTMSEVLNDM